MSGTLEGFHDQMVRAGNIRMHAVVGGKGPPLVLIHGFPQTWWEWRKMMPRLAETHTVVAVDLRGAGHSDCPQGGYEKVTMAADVHAVMNALGHERYVVCEHESHPRPGRASLPMGVALAVASFIQFTASPASRRPYPRDPHALQGWFRRRSPDCAAVSMAIAPLLV